MGYCWDTVGILLEYCWDTVGILLGRRFLANYAFQVYLKKQDSTRKHDNMEGCRFCQRCRRVLETARTTPSARISRFGFGFEPCLGECRKASAILREAGHLKGDRREVVFLRAMWLTTPLHLFRLLVTLVRVFLYKGMAFA